MLIFFSPFDSYFQVLLGTFLSLPNSRFYVDSVRFVVLLESSVIELSFKLKSISSYNSHFKNMFKFSFEESSKLRIVYIWLEWLLTKFDLVNANLIIILRPFCDLLLNKWKNPLTYANSVIKLLDVAIYTKVWNPFQINRWVSVLSNRIEIFQIQSCKLPLKIKEVKVAMGVLLILIIPHINISRSQVI